MFPSNSRFKLKGRREGERRIRGGARKIRQGMKRRDRFGRIKFPDKPLDPPLARRGERRED